MELADYGYYIDWNADGDFNDANEDISAYVLRSSWSSGIPNAPPEHATAGRCTLVLDNSTSIFSSFNPSSPLHELIRPGLKIRITMTIGQGSPVIMWQGYLETIIPIVGELVNVSTAELTAYGILAQFADGDVDVPLQEDIKTGEAIVVLLDQDEFPPGDRAIDAGQSTLSKWWIKKGSSRLQAIHDLEDAELGRVREGKDGKFVFEDRSYPFVSTRGANVQSTYGTGTLRPYNLRQIDSLPGVFNLVQSNIRTFNISDEMTLVVVSDVANNQGSDPLKVPGNGSLTTWLEFPTPTSPAGYIAVQEWTMVDYEANKSADGSGDDITGDVSAVKTSYGPKLKIVFTNSNSSNAYLVVLRAHGIATVESDPVPIKSESATSQGKYRKRPYPYPCQWITDQADGQALLDYIIQIYKDPRARLQFEVRGNYDAAHLAEVQARDVSDRIRVTAEADFGLYIDAEFLIDSIAHQVDEARLHTATIICTIAPAVQLGELGTPKSPRTVPVVEEAHVPDQLYANAIPAGNRVAFGCLARKWNATITEGEFRAKLFTDSNPSYADLRTPSEGGTLVHDGSTQFVVTGIVASFIGCRYTIRNSLQGRWFYAFRLKNSKGWSTWSDGNDDPQYVRDYIDTEDPALTPTGPPEDWDVWIHPGQDDNHVTVRATRPKTSGARIWSVSFQIKDKTTGQWRDIDENAGAAVTTYDGSAIAHIYDPMLGTITKAAGDYGSAAPGDFLLIDVRGSAFNEKYCNWHFIGEGEISGNTLSNVIGCDPFYEPDGEGKFQDLRIKIVRPPYLWDSEGYLGADPDHGYDNQGFWENGQKGDRETAVFESIVFELPSGLTAPDVEGRVWFCNGYSFSDDDITGGYSPAGDVPDKLSVIGQAYGLEIVSQVKAEKNNKDIYQADFRAKYYAAGGAAFPASVDLRTPEEGGTFVHDGSTAYVVNGQFGNENGSMFRIISPGDGRWYYAWRLRNKVGWSLWTDGNANPVSVKDWIDSNDLQDNGPPQDWDVSLAPGPEANTYIVHATRPRVNGNVIVQWAVQIKDGSTGSWRKFDDNAGAAETHYDGSAISHHLENGNTRIVRDAGSGFSDAALEDLLLIDVRGATFDVQHCNGDIVKEIGDTYVDLQAPVQVLAGVDSDLRVKIVKPVWNWNSEGYLGDSPGRGYWDPTFVGNYVLGDTKSKEFISGAIQIPDGITQPEARAWFRNGYSTADNDAGHSTGIGAVGSGVIVPRTFKDFSDQDFWIPIYPVAAYEGMAINEDGTATFTCPGVNHATLDHTFAGFRSRFLLSPDTDGYIKFRVKFTGCTLSDKVYSSRWGIGALLLIPGAGSGNVQGVMYRSKSTDATKGRIGEFPATSFTNPLLNENAAVADDLTWPADGFSMNMTYKYGAHKYANGVGATDGPGVDASDIKYSVNGGAWVGLSNNSSPKNDFLPFNVCVIIGLWGVAKKETNVVATLAEFELQQGYGVAYAGGKE